MQLNQPLHQRQPDPQPTLRPLQRTVHLREHLEDRLEIVGRNADPRVAHADRGFVADQGVLHRGASADVLAAVNFVETKFGKLRSSSAAGAQGPMQFIPATWRRYGLGGNVRDAHDAILGAAGLGDIGEMFPDTAGENKNRDSIEMLGLAVSRPAYIEALTPSEKVMRKQGDEILVRFC